MGHLQGHHDVHNVLRSGFCSSRPLVLDFSLSIELFVIRPGVANFVIVLLEQTLFSFKPVFVTMILLYHDERQKRENKPMDIYYKHAARVNDAYDSMEVDQRLLATNLLTSAFLDQFFSIFFNVLKQEPLVDKIEKQQIL
jgi:hypothetical protein